ncbi:MAG TPA: trimethylamine methyltransferase family protein [bacterium]|nr:trimethylamine methyltransferase family protein [bacterium]HOL35293.1 trimethylamine methyltransferase family protein [bacterium]HPP08834.1 trimethylamine methyltransferase family protein [bacterium]
MSKVKFHLSGGLTENEIKKTHENALQILDRIGIHTPSQYVINRVEGKRGVKIKNDTRICIAPEIVEQLIGPFPKTSHYSNDELSFHVSGYALRCYDFRTGEIKKPTTTDMIEFTKIAHTLGVSGSSIVMPQDLPQKLAEVATYKLCLDVSDKIWGAGIFSDSVVFDIVQEIQIVIGLPYTVGMHMISPLAFDPFLLEMAIRYIPKKASFSVGNMPMRGATCPIDIMGAIAQSCAEVLGGACILKMIAPESEVSFAPFIYPFDMRYATIVYGGPDFIMGNLALNQVAKFYGTSVMAKACNTMAKRPDDAQVGVNAAGFVLMMLAGMKKFGWSGTCCIDEIGSIEEVIIEYEIFKFAQHIANGFDFKDQDDLIETIDECVQAGSFLMHENTLENYHNEFFESDIFSNDNFMAWDKEGRKSLLKKARSKALKLLDSHSFYRDKQQQQELDKIWEQAKKMFTG